MILLALAAAALAGAETPRHFVERVYAGYGHESYDPLAHPERLFAPALVAAIHEDQRLAKGEVGFLDGDPVCDCQDPGGLRATIAEIVTTAPNAATARVALRFGPDRRALTLRLVRTAAGWRIADIASQTDPSLLKDLQASNRRQRTGH
ncbi:MAG TPA: DUF3828 domain-containing protein [Allosphingosinicella sp.]|nr:DUF3828 domain-containing protein [Allosphingosinicella sp.]